MSSHTITLSLGWQQVDPDGSACCICGDACYLAQWVLVAVVSGVPQQPTETEPGFCQSCRDALELDG